MGKILHFSACRGEEYFTAPHNTSRRGGFSFTPVPSRPTGGTKLALLDPIGAQAGKNSPSTLKTPQNQRFFACRANFFSVSPRIQTCSASFLSPISIPGFTLAGRYAHSPNLAWCAHTPQGRWHTGRMTDAPHPALERTSRPRPRPSRPWRSPARPGMSVAPPPDCSPSAACPCDSSRTHRRARPSCPELSR